MSKFNAFRPTLNAMEERSLMSATFAALPAEPVPCIVKLYQSGGHEGLTKVGTGHLILSNANDSAHKGAFEILSFELGSEFTAKKLTDAASPATLIGTGTLEFSGVRVDAGAGDISKFGSKGLSLMGDGSYGDNPVSDDVIIDGRIITAENPATATSHELGHTLGFRHEHTRPDASGHVGRDVLIGGLGDDWLSGGTGQDATSASAPFQGKRSTGGYVPT